MKERISEIKAKGVQANEKLEAQFKRIADICEENAKRVKYFEDLKKKEKIFDMIYKTQNDKINLKETKI